MERISRGYFNYNANSNKALSFVHCGIKQNEPNELCGPTSKNIYLLHFIIDGKGTYYINDKVYNLKKGDVFAIFPDDVVSYKADENEPWYFCWIGFMGTNASEYYKHIGFTENSLITHLDNNLFIKGIMNCLDYIEENEKRDLSMLRLDAFVLEILSSFETAVQNSSKAYIQSAVIYMEMNYNKKISLSDVANIIGLEYSYFFKLFKNEIGISPNEYLINLRIEKAKKLLKANTEIKNIPALVGISDVYYFTKLFKKCVGTTPSDYRKKLN